MDGVALNETSYASATELIFCCILTLIQCFFNSLKCVLEIFNMHISRRSITTTAVTENRSGKMIFILMVSVAFFISGILERLSESNSLLSNVISLSEESRNESNQGRRYCDPPNMTALTAYYDSNEETNDDYASLSNQEMIVENRISLNETLQGMFFNWGLTLSFLPGCFLTSRFGAGNVFSYSLLFLIISLLKPKSVYSKYILNIITGSSCGIFVFSFYLMVYQFATFRRNSLISFASVRHLGLAIGELLILFSTIRNYAFYATAVLTVIWFLIWSKIQFTSQRVQTFNKEHNKRKINNSKLNTPWKDVLGSRPIWMTIAAIFGASCAQSCIFKFMRLYLQSVYYLNVETLSAFSSLLHVGFAVSCGFIIDYLISAHIVSVTSSRRMTVYLSHFIPSGLLFVLGFVGCGVTTPIVLYCLSIMMTGANYTGAFSSPLDLAPKYLGPILALCFSFGSLGIPLMDHLVLYILTNQVFVSWRFIFSLNSLILLLTAIFFMLRGSGSVQPWNDPNNKPKERINKQIKKGRVLTTAPVPKPRTKSIYMVEKKILKVLHVQEPDKFTRVRAYSTSFPNERSNVNPPNIYRPSNKKRASIS